MNIKLEKITLKLKELINDVAVVEAVVEFEDKIA